MARYVIEVEMVGDWIFVTLSRDRIVLHYREFHRREVSEFLKYMYELALRIAPMGTRPP